MRQPRFSVLLPTRNGGRFLRACIESVLAQGRDDVELVVSDNANVDQTSAVLQEFVDDPRLVIVRLDAPVPVTDNWNAALLASRGEYVLMIGDDDLLLPEYFDVVSDSLERWGNPDCLSYNAYRFVAPDAIAGLGESYYGEWYFEVEERIAGGGILTGRYRQELVRSMFRFRTRFPLTMQVTLVSRAATTRLPNGLFHSPFPDHYALAALMLTSTSWAYEPIRPLVIGVSEKSFGHFYFNLEDSGGLTYLGIEPSFPGMLPGNDVLNVLHTWLLDLLGDFRDQLSGVHVDRAQYLVRQLWAWLQDLRFGALSRREFLRRLQALPPGDWIQLTIGLLRPANVRHALGVLPLTRKDRMHPLWRDLHAIPDVRSIESFGRWIQQRGVTTIA